jgi:CubicO group peptidase (beta-lactamase class C family)
MEMSLGEGPKNVKRVVNRCLLAALIGHSFPCQVGTSFASLARANSTEAPSSASTLLNVAELDGLIARIVQEKHLIGLSVGVMQNGKVVLEKGYGLSSLKTSDPVTPETLFAIGSITKQFTCAALLLLAKEGKLLLDDPVAKYDPSLTRAADITFLDLSQHVSGYHDYYPMDFVDRPMSQPKATDEVIRDYASRPLDFEPGTRWSYSNTGYLILGRIVERVSGEPLGRFLERRIFKPLGLNHTRYEPRRDETGLAQGYTPFGLGSPQACVPEGKGWVEAAGAIWSTPRDLLTWDLALMEGKVLSPSSYRTMTTSRRLPDGRFTGYGCGLSIRDQGAALILSHGGAVSGFNAWNGMIPATRSAVVILANMDFALTQSLRDAILAKVLPATDIPTVVGPSAKEVALAFLQQLREGKIDRENLGEEFSAYLTKDRLSSVTESMTDKEVKELEVVSTSERGRMEVATIRFRLGEVPMEALMYRTSDGKIQQFLFYRQ